MTPIVESGLIFNIQKYSVQDGPGIRTTVFLKGCPLRCAWCHNPESQSARREIIVLENRCLACGECRRACPVSPALEAEAPLPPRPAECSFCGACARACPAGARQIVGEAATVEQVLATVLQDRVFYEDSGGGVTFSGGEPLAQPVFLQALLAASRAAGLSTALDTCGYSSRESLIEAASSADLVLFDVKLMDDAKHRKYTGASNALILENLDALASVHHNIWLRVPVIPGITDGRDDLLATARLAKTLKSIRQVNLLPYHKTALPKLRRLGHTPELAGVDTPSGVVMEDVARLFRDFGLNVRIGG